MELFIDFTDSNAEIAHSIAKKCLYVKLIGIIETEKLREIFLSEYQTIQKYSLTNCIINLSDLELYSPGMQELVGNEWFPTVKHKGIRNIAIVIPRNFFGQLAMELVHEESETAKIFRRKYFQTYDQAVGWIESME